MGTQVAAALLGTVGDNPGRLGTEASFAALCGAVFSRMSHDPRTKAYVERRTKEGKTTKEIMRCLKRYVAREVYRSLVSDARDALATAAPLAA